MFITHLRSLANSPALHRIIKGAFIFYVVIVLLTLVISWVIPVVEARGLLRTLFGLLLFPAVVMLPLSALLRLRWQTLLLISFVLVWAATYGTLLVPRSVAVDEESFRFTVLTFNVQTADENLDSLSQVILDADADLVALQELGNSATQHLNQTLAERYPYQALYPQEDPHWGQGIVSRFPIVEDQFWRNEEIEVALGHMWAEIDLAGQFITVFSTHPVPPLSFEKGFTLQAHSQEIAILLERAAQHDTPLLLVGDFNMTEWMDEYADVAAEYVDTFREAGDAGFGFTFPARFRFSLPPLVRLDYVFHSQHFKGIRAYPFPRSGPSDHLPFWAELALVSAASTP